MVDLKDQVENLKDRQVDIAAITAQHGVEFAALSPEVKAAMVNIAQIAWYAGGEAYL